HRVLQNWGQGASDAGDPGGAGTQAAPGDATWLNTFYPGLFWTNPGGDFSPTVSASVPVTSVGFYTWGSTPSMVADVQSWLSNPASNFGWLLLGNETQQQTVRRYDSRENPIASVRPVLKINYFPEPATLVLLAAGAVALSRRRG